MALASGREQNSESSMNITAGRAIVEISRGSKEIGIYDGFAAMWVGSKTDPTAGN
jgi:hypothetical protein